MTRYKYLPVRSMSASLGNCSMHYSINCIHAVVPATVMCKNYPLPLHVLTEHSYLQTQRSITGFYKSLLEIIVAINRWELWKLGHHIIGGHKQNALVGFG